MATTKRRNRRCQQCGSCCRELILDCNIADVKREPRIASECTEMLRDEWTGERMWNLNDLCKKCVCHFLTAEGRCEIHQTKPGMCRAFTPNTDGRCRHTTVKRGTSQ